jgi:hypothetical protein
VEILQAMRTRGDSDLQITCVAMGFIIKSGLVIIESAIHDVQKIGIPNLHWIYRLDKVYAQNRIGRKLDEKLVAIDNFNTQLQSAISIANYSLNLQQLENCLDATSSLQNKFIR